MKQEVSGDLISATIGPDTSSRELSEADENRVDALRFLLKAGFPQGENGWRGKFFSFVIGEALTGLGDPFFRAMATVIISHLKAQGRTLLSMTAEYYWLSNVETLQSFVAYGVLRRRTKL